MRLTLCVLLCLAVSSANSATPRVSGPAENFYEATKQPAEDLDARTKMVLADLSKSRVPTDREAVALALGALGVDARGGLRGDRPLSACPVGKSSIKDGELVWEVRLSRSSMGLSGVVWVFCSTTKTQILFR